LKRTIQPHDLKFIGYIRFAAKPSSMQFAKLSMTMRHVNGELRLFATGNNDKGHPMLEWAVTSEPQIDITKSPFLSFRRDWGSIHKNPTTGATYCKTGSSAGGGLGGLCYDEAQDTLWWSYGDGYVPTMHHPTICATRLNETDGTYQTNGPWRTTWHCNKTRGHWTTIPEWFRPHVGGHSFGVMAGQESGNASSPWGAALAALDLPDDPMTAPPDPTSGTIVSVPNYGIILHDFDHRQARDNLFKTCGWKQPYDWTKGGTMLRGFPTFGSKSTGVGENDTMNSCVWIDTESYHGLLYFGQLVTTPIGYTPPGVDPDGLCHMWYGDFLHGSKYGDPSRNGKCVHLQDDPYWKSTGPGAHMRVPHGWIYNPYDLVDTAQKLQPLWSRVPTSTWQWHTIVPQIRRRRPSYPFGGAYFEQESKRLYVMYRVGDSDLTIANVGRPALLVFQLPLV
jgi:hypothetical protein